MKRTLLILIFFSFCSLAEAQEDFGWYFNPKLGPAVWPKYDDGGLMVGVELGYFKNKNIWTSSFQYGGLLVPESDAYDPGMMKAIDAKYGRYIQMKHSRFSYHAGLGILYGDQWNEGKVERFSTWSLPIDIGIVLLSSCFGLGVELQANINPKHLFMSAMLSLEFGKLK